MRTGIGYDIHRLIPSIRRSEFPLGGVPISCYFTVEAHSDGDVLLHSLTDACLGAMALGDLGQWFPDSKPENQNRPSSEFLKEVLHRIHAMGWRVAQCDSIIFLEEPKLAEHWTEIRESVARILGIEITSVSVKAKTMEGLGAIGSRKAIAAQAIVLLEEKK